jgi:hypothetical protein
VEDGSAIVDFFNPELKKTAGSNKNSDLFTGGTQRAAREQSRKNTDETEFGEKNRRSTVA